MKSVKNSGTESSGNGLTSKVRHLAGKMNVVQVIAALDRRYPPALIRRIYWQVCEDKPQRLK